MKWLAYRRHYYPQGALPLERLTRLRSSADLRQILLEPPPGLADTNDVA